MTADGAQRVHQPTPLLRNSWKTKNMSSDWQCTPKEWRKLQPHTDKTEDQQNCRIIPKWENQAQWVSPSRDNKALRLPVSKLIEGLEKNYIGPCFRSDFNIFWMASFKFITLNKIKYMPQKTTQMSLETLAMLQETPSIPKLRYSYTQRKGYTAKCCSILLPCIAVEPQVL